MFLFVELETRRNPPSIQEIYRILLHMRSAAVDIIIRHLPGLFTFVLKKVLALNLL